MTSFSAGPSYLARCGEAVHVDTRSGSRLYGKVYYRQVHMTWNLDGTQFPGGGTGPYDLVRPNRVEEHMATSETVVP